MRKLIFGAIVGGLAAWLYRSQQARDLAREQLANAPAPVRAGAESLTAAAGNAAERAAGMIDSSALPRQVKDSALRVTSAVQAAAGEARPDDSAAREAPSVVEAAVPVPAGHAAPDDVLAEEDAAKRGAAEARREQQSGV